MKNIFISYNWDNKKDVHEIVGLLRSKDEHQVWLDENNMNAGDILHGEIKKGIENCKLFVAFITKKYCESQNCQLEIKYAFEMKKKCIYVKLEENLGDDKAGIGLLIAGSLRLNGFDYKKDKSWPVNLYNQLSNDIKKHLNNEESLQL